LWEAYNLSKRMKLRPSEVYFIKDELTAWSFDRAVLNFGAEVEADLESIEDKNGKALERKRTARLNRWLGTAPQFKDPAAR
jgi:hypothetical protein